MDGGRINQYFNGRCTDSEILFKADITRKQLRELLHQYEEYVSSTITGLSMHSLNPNEYHITGPNIPTPFISLSTQAPDASTPTTSPPSNNQRNSCAPPSSRPP